MGLERSLPRHLRNDVGTEFEKIVQGVDDRNIATRTGAPNQSADDTQSGPFLQEPDDQ